MLSPLDKRGVSKNDKSYIQPSSSKRTSNAHVARNMQGRSFTNKATSQRIVHLRAAHQNDGPRDRTSGPFKCKLATKDLALCIAVCMKHSGAIPEL